MKFKKVKLLNGATPIQIIILNKKIRFLFTSLSNYRKREGWHYPLSWYCFHIWNREKHIQFQFLGFQIGIEK